MRLRLPPLIEFYCNRKTIMTKKITQFSGINALMGGVFKGLFPISEIKKHGNFGLGCSDGLTGEVIIDCCHFFDAKDNKPLRVMEEAEEMPFAQITTFAAEEKFAISNLSKATLYQELSKHLKFDNVFLALKLEGIFRSVKVRRPRELRQRFNNALEVAQHQIIDNISNVEGQLIGFWTPEFFQNISVAGFHLHFIDKEKTTGGHMIDFTVDDGTLSYEVKYGLDIELSDKRAYIDHDLKIDDMDKIIKKVEN